MWQGPAGTGEGPAGAGGQQPPAAGETEAGHQHRGQGPVQPLQQPRPVRPGGGELFVAEEFVLAFKYRY